MFILEWERDGHKKKKDEEEEEEAASILVSTHAPSPSFWMRRPGSLRAELSDGNGRIRLGRRKKGVRREGERRRRKDTLEIR